MVLDDASPERCQAQWRTSGSHQYLIFYPLGARYWASQEAREINETTADLVGQEVGEQLIGSLAAARPPRATATGGAARIDFREFMRATRGRIEELLRASDVDGAEAYMRDRRDELERAGYVVRKLNQAYFALYGSYGEGYAAAPDNPVPRLLRELRATSPTLVDFLVRVRAITTVEELRAAVG